MKIPIVKMDKKSAFLFSFLFIIFAGVVIFAWYKFFVQHDYLVSYELPCSSAEQSKCFVRDCDGEATCIDANYYYKTIERLPSSIESCKGDSACELVDCSAVTTVCHEIYLDE